MQICTEILCHLASNGPMNLIHLSRKADIKEKQLKKHLKLLQDSHLITKENFSKNNIFFVISESGLAVLKMVRPLIAETHKTKTYDFTTIATPI